MHPKFRLLPSVEMTIGVAVKTVLGCLVLRSATTVLGTRVGRDNSKE